MSNPFEPNTTYYQKRRYGYDGGAYGQERTSDELQVVKATPHTITTPDGKRYKVCDGCVKVDGTLFCFSLCEKELKFGEPNKNKKADLSDETLARFAKLFPKGNRGYEDAKKQLDILMDYWRSSPCDYEFESKVIGWCEASV